jgi:hypothetical protein
MGYDVFFFEEFTIKAKVMELHDKADMVKWKDTINIYAVPRR